jgi:3-oxoacyl-[acyl-carrier protein] reductase
MISFNKNDLFIVTGASSGIGRATALKLNILGATVIINGRKDEELKRTKDMSSKPSLIYIEKKDLADDIESNTTWITQLSEKYGKLRGLVLSAGNYYVSPLQSLTIKKSKIIFDINYFSNIALAKGFCHKGMNIGIGSSIVFISSIASITGNAGIIDYSASKAAINAAVKSMAAEVAKYGIRVNVVLPGFVKTELLETLKDYFDEKHLEEMERQYPLGFGEPDDVAGLICFLLSDSTKWMTGSDILIDGGRNLL